MSTATPPNEPSPPQRQAPGVQLEPNILAFFAVVVPPLSSILIGKATKAPPFARFYAIQGTVFGVIGLIGFAAIPLLGRWIGDDSDGKKLFFLLLVMGFSLCWCSVWMAQLFAALLHKRWVIPLIAPITRRFLDATTDRA